MSKQPKKRLCWSCDGSVSMQEENCPYCGVTVVPASLDNSHYQGHYQFTPPYQMGMTQENEVPPPPYSTSSTGGKEQVNFNKNQETTPHEDLLSDQEASEYKHFLIASLLLLSSSVLFVFGLVLLFFSKNGTFTLKWDGSLWYIYISIALPLFFIGWRSALKL